jgi:hypothetical protein
LPAERHTPAGPTSEQLRRRVLAAESDSVAPPTVAERMRRSTEFAGALYDAKRVASRTATLAEAREAYVTGLLTLEEFERAVVRLHA